MSDGSVSSNPQPLQLSKPIPIKSADQPATFPFLLGLKLSSQIIIAVANVSQTPVAYGKAGTWGRAAGSIGAGMNSFVNPP